MPLDLERSTLAFADVTAGNSGARQVVLHIFLTPTLQSVGSRKKAGHVVPTGRLVPRTGGSHKIRASSGTTGKSLG